MRSTLLVLWCAAACAFRVAVSGAHGRLGRELIYQSLERRWDSVGFSRRPMDPLFRPNRQGFLSEATRFRTPMRAPGLNVVPYGHNVSFEALVFCVSGRPFEEDDSDRVVADLCKNLPSSCQKVCLVSAYGVGDSLPGSNLGIRAMESWYLRDVYASKRRQEMLVSAIPHPVEVLIVRPRALSNIQLRLSPNSISRKDMAREILDWIGS